MLWLGVLPPEGRKRDALWFCTPSSELSARVSDVESAEEPPDVGMSLDTPSFVAVHEAFRYRL